MAKDKKKISVYSVHKATGVSKTFLYAHKEILDIIDGYRHPAPSPALSEETAETVIAALRIENKRLKEENQALKRDGLWKEKYEHLKQENKLLKERIERLLGEMY